MMGTAPALIHAAGLSDQPLMIGEDARLLLLLSDIDAQGKVLMLPEVQPSAF
jgi:hypothetical protein